MITFVLCILIILTIKNIYMSLFCKIIKSRDQKRIEHLNHRDNICDVKVSEDVDKYKRHHQRNRIISLFLKLSEDFVFLDFKLIGYVPSHFLRNLLYKIVFKMEIGKNAVIYYGLEARSPWNIKIGDGSIIGDHAVLDARWGITIGKNVNFSTGVWVWTLQHDLNDANFSTEVKKEGSVVISDRSWVSSRTTLLPGVFIAEGAVVASGAVVTKTVDVPFSVVGGVPAKKISDRNHNLSYVFDGKHRYFI